jgi:hypothetical protein
MTLCPSHLLDHPEGCPWCVVDSLTHSGNGEVIKNWMKAHGKAMDRLEETEEKLRKAQIALNTYEHNAPLIEERAYRIGYRDGATAVNTVGEDALDHVEMHLKKWMEEI